MKRSGMLWTAGMMLLCAMLAGGCGPYTSEADLHKDHYAVRLYNASDQRVEQIKWWMADRPRMRGRKTSLRPGTGGGYGSYWRPIPRDLILSWQDPKTEEQREAAFDLWQSVAEPASFEGSFFLVYVAPEDGWKLAALTWDEKRAWVLSPKDHIEGPVPPLPPELYQDQDHSADEGGQP